MMPSTKRIRVPILVAAAVAGTLVLLAGPSGARTATHGSVSSGTCTATDDSVCSGSGVASDESTSSGGASEADGSVGSGGTPSPTLPPPSSPSGIVRATYEAWAAGDRAAAAQVAEPAVVDTLFARTWSSADGWAFLNCQGAAGTVFCVWQRPGEELLIAIRNSGNAERASAVQFRPRP